jgi:hypothetical protein
VYSVTGSAGSVSITQANRSGGTEQYKSGLPVLTSFWILPKKISLHFRAKSG